MISKTIHILCFVSIFTTMESQTITDAFLPSIGDTILLEIASNPEVFAPGGIGLDQVWDFTNAAGNPDDDVPRLIISAEEAETFSSFPEATFAQISTTSTNVYMKGFYPPLLSYMVKNIECFERNRSFNISIKILSRFRF